MGRFKRGDGQRIQLTAVSLALTIQVFSATVKTLKITPLGFVLSKEITLG